MQSVEHMTLDLRVMSSSPILGAEPTLKKRVMKGYLVAHLIKHLTLAQVMISWFVGLSPVSGYADRSESGAYFGFCVSLSASSQLVLTQNIKINIKNKYLKKVKIN